MFGRVAFKNGLELRKVRKSLGWTQSNLAVRAGFSRSTVIYWERRQNGLIRGVAPERFRDVLILAGAKLPERIPSYFERQAISHSSEQSKVDSITAAPKSRESKCGLRFIACGAITRKGEKCKHKPISSNGRCKYHGGLSTGPKTANGRRAIGLAQQNRWQRYRDGKALQTLTLD